MAAFDLDALPPEVTSFLTERHLGTLTVLAPDGGPRVTPVGFTYDPERRLARVITWASSWKAQHVAAGHDPRAAIGSVDGGRWLTIYGAARVADGPESVEEGVRRYAQRYRQPKERSDRVVIEIEVDKIVGRA
ncbi:MAG: pyridoxamine 5'-phosphate oxidase family protein [Acidimicrobiia bacterium]